MVCIYCGNKTRVSNSRGSKKAHSTWRRRECLGCGSIFTTREQVDFGGAIRVRKASGRLEPFQRDKLLISLNDSLSHRKTALRDATALTDTIMHGLAKLHTNGILEVSVLLDSAYRALNRFDKAAGVYYRAHHS